MSDQPDWESISDEEWARTLAARISGQTGEAWTGAGIERAVVVAMTRAREQERAAVLRYLRTEPAWAIAVFGIEREEHRE